MITRCVNCSAENSANDQFWCKECGGEKFWTRKGLIVARVSGLKIGDLVSELGKWWKVERVIDDVVMLRALSWVESVGLAYRQWRERKAK